ncbi:hypothetical protein [Variovorax sp. J31P207]|uniref:hypothetical protein n=1 Tax=Variovorax sp. J31P207 TaxID=3053510 RepID=UPI002578746A|nr:hypothetical protein [Variovorax sp. J31P207]MDM0067073.1 hypothetical protein [Variovorax sp. J31P207]
MDSPFLDFLHANRYSDIRRVNGLVCGLSRFNFTYGLVVDIGWSGYGRRYCYELESDARAALATWDGEDHPSGPWIKCKGAGIDLLNPLMT